MNYKKLYDKTNKDTFSLPKTDNTLDTLTEATSDTEEQARTKVLLIFPHTYHLKFCIYAQVPIFYYNT